MTHSANLKARNMNFSSQIFVKKYQGGYSPNFFAIKHFLSNLILLQKQKLKGGALTGNF